MTALENLIARTTAMAALLNQQNEFGALHIVVSDGNMEDEDIEFCMEQPNITPDEMEFAQKLRREFSEEERFMIYAIANCLQADALAEKEGMR